MFFHHCGSCSHEQIRYGVVFHPKRSNGSNMLRCVLMWLGRRVVAWRFIRALDLALDPVLLLLPPLEALLAAILDLTQPLSIWTLNFCHFIRFILRRPLPYFVLHTPTVHNSATSGKNLFARFDVFAHIALNVP